ncbi:MAG TPA: hypothetical protein VGN42_07470 [Pirellulales bacterium]|jgi:phage FluMu protein Com/uncharacterized membrane protein|nr:hypothetical protein [Pirellulales bacterium]
MPIEFRCHQCGKLLRVADETAGRQAKCPACGVVQQIPAASPAPMEPPVRALPPAAAPTGDPFGAMPLPPPKPGGEQNPYQSPPSYPGQGAYGFAGGEAHAAPYRRTPIDVGDVLTRTWEIYKDQMGLCIGCVMLCGVINYATQFVGQIINTGMEAAQLPLGVVVSTNVVLLIGQLVFQLWISVGQTMLLLKIARGEAASIGVIFEGGRYLLPTILASLAFGLGIFALVAICAIVAGLAYLATKEPAVAVVVFVAIYLVPGIYASLTFMQYFYLIVDRDLGAIESLTASREITQGNKLSIFAVGLIGGALYLAGALVCCVGAIFTGPYVVLSFTVMYLLMSGGQPAARFQR